MNKQRMMTRRFTILGYSVLMAMIVPSIAIGQHYEFDQIRILDDFYPRPGEIQLTKDELTIRYGDYTQHFVVEADLGTEGNFHSYRVLYFGNACLFTFGEEQGIFLADLRCGALYFFRQYLGLND